MAAGRLSSCRRQAMAERCLGQCEGDASQLESVLTISRLAVVVTPVQLLVLASSLNDTRPIN